MKLDISEKSFDIVKHLLSNTYVELAYQRDREDNSPVINKKISDTAELIRVALKEMGILVNPAKAELDKEGNFK